MRPGENNTLVLESIGEQITALKALEGTRNQDTAPETFAELASFLTLEAGPAAYEQREVIVPGEEKEIVLNSLRHRSQRRLSIYGAHARRALAEFDSYTS